MKSYKCKSTHTRAYWVDNIRYDFHFEKDKIYQISKLEKYMIIYLDDMDIVMKSVNENFSGKFKIYDNY